jgi:hypothetical protein
MPISLRAMIWKRAAMRWWSAIRRRIRTSPR